MDSFSSFLFSLETAGRKSKKNSKADDVKRVCASKLPTQSIQDDHNYNKNLDEVDTCDSLPCLNDNASEEIDAVFKSKVDSSGEDSFQNKKICNKFQTESCLHKIRERSQTQLSKEKVNQCQDRLGDSHQGSDRKRNLVNDEALPVKKKLNVDGLRSHKTNVDGLCSHKTDQLTSELEKAVNVDDNTEDPYLKKVKNPQQKLNEEVSSVRVVEGRFIDFRCVVCKELPRRLNRSELYRHYANHHFYSKLYDLIGQLKICPHCDLDLRNVSSPAHFGQKHSYVEKFLPKEDWIPLSSCGANISTSKTFPKAAPGTVKPSKKLNTVDNIGDPPFEALWVWPETPEGFNPDGNVRGSKWGFTNLEQSLIIANLEGFDIEVKKDEGSKDISCKQEGFGNQKGASPLSPSSNEYVFRCRICKMKFENKQNSVLHVQSVHFMKGSGDVFHDYDVLLKTGYLMQETAASTVQAATVDVVDLCQDTAVEEAQSMELTEEEWGLVNAVDRYQQSDGVEAVEEISPHKGDGRCDVEGEIEFNALHSENYEVNESLETSNSEWEVDHKDIQRADSRHPAAYLESDEAVEEAEEDWEEALAVESIKDLQVIIPGRESGYGSASGYSGNSS